jgi:hypothetical protein
MAFLPDDLFYVCRGGDGKRVTFFELDDEWVSKAGDTMSGDLIIEGEVAEDPVDILVDGAFYEILTNTGNSSDWIRSGALSNAIGEVFQSIRDFDLSAGNTATQLTNPAHLTVGGFVQTSEVRTPHYDLEDLPDAD